MGLLKDVDLLNTMEPAFINENAGVWVYYDDGGVGGYGIYKSLLGTSKEEIRYTVHKIIKHPNWLRDTVEWSDIMPLDIHPYNLWHRSYDAALDSLVRIKQGVPQVVRAKKMKEFYQDGIGDIRV